MLFAGSLGASIVASAAPALAAGDPICVHGGNNVAEACFYDALQYGDFTGYRNANMYFLPGDGYLESDGDHLNQSIWSYSGQPCDAWVEEGVTQGYHGVTEYTWYWAYQTTGGFYDDFPAGLTSPDNSLHYYELAYVGGASGTEWAVVRDEALVGTMDLGPTAGGACQGATGLEVSANIEPDVHADTFNANPLQWEDGGGNWYFGWNTSEYWNDFPCGAGYNPPSCFNGVFYGSNSWADNKP
ncbi:MAG: hypothetical protein ACRDYC_09930 [Acidimicrobiales bacterium]